MDKDDILLPGELKAHTHMGVELSENTVAEIAEYSEYIISKAVQFQQLMMMYSCATKEIRTKLEVLNAEFSVRFKRNPIKFVDYRLKKPASIAKKLDSHNIDFSLENIEKYVNDVAGIRVICAFIDDIYEIAGALTGQDDITLINEKDYIKKPKENGYRSLHLILQVPVFFSDHKRLMKVEVQIRTIAMDFWASLEHQLKYKQTIKHEKEIVAELKECAETIAETDMHMMGIRNRIDEEAEAYTKEDEIMAYLEKLDIPMQLF